MREPFWSDLIAFTLKQIFIKGLSSLAVVQDLIEVDLGRPDVCEVPDHNFAGLRRK